ncbi:MAG: hypothetical protein ACO1OC_10160 [Tuberibacillus sp.]
MKWLKGGRYQIIYLDQNNQLSSRHIRVLQDRQYILTAYCYQKRGIRSFIKENILGVQKIDSAAEWLPKYKKN